MTSARRQAGATRPAKFASMTGAAIVAFALVLFGTTPATPVPVSNGERACEQFPRKWDYCNGPLALWIPRDTDPFDAFDAWRRGAARTGTPSDPFVDSKHRTTVDFPEDGRPLKPPPGFEGTNLANLMGVHAADPVHHIVFMHEYCCGAEYRVLERTTGPAPVRLPVADLSGVHTRSGIRLGMHERDVVARLGRTHRYRMAGHPGLAFLGYTSIRRPAGAAAGAPDEGGHCPYAMLFALRDDHVVSIAWEQSC
jgi:hypothetical protein